MTGIPRRPGTRTPSRDLQAALVDAAEAVLVREGPMAVTVRAVAAEAGVAPMGVYNRFGNKEGLMSALLMRGFAGLRDATAGRGELDPIARLRESGIRYRQFALTHPRHYTLMFGEVWPQEDIPEELRACAESAFENLVDHVATAMAAGYLRAGDVQEAAQQIWSAVHGAVTLEMQGLARTADPEATYLELLDLLVRGMSVAPDQHPDRHPGGGADRPEG